MSPRFTGMHCVRFLTWYLDTLALVLKSPELVDGVNFPCTIPGAESMKPFITVECTGIDGGAKVIFNHALSLTGCVFEVGG